MGGTNGGLVSDGGFFSVTPSVIFKSGSFLRTSLSFSTLSSRSRSRLSTLRSSRSLARAALCSSFSSVISLTRFAGFEIRLPMRPRVVPVRTIASTTSTITLIIAAPVLPASFARHEPMRAPAAPLLGRRSASAQAVLICAPTVSADR